MGFLFGGGRKSMATNVTVASGLQLQSSVQGQVIPVVYGTTRIAQNLIWYGSFTATPVSSPSGGGGKGGIGGGGGGKGGGPSGQYNYSTAFAGALSEGPINGVINVYVNKNVTDLADQGLTFFDGSDAQAAWGYLVTNFPNQALQYSNYAYVAASSFALGNNPQLPNFNFEVQGIFSNSIEQEIAGEQYTIPGDPFQISVVYAATWIADVSVVDADGNVYTNVPSNPGPGQYTASAGLYTFNSNNSGTVVNINYTTVSGPDADPSLIVNDILTSTQYGVSFPNTRVASLTQYQAYCIATGLVISPAYSTQAPAGNSLTDIAKATNSAVVWANGQLNLIPYGDQSVTANGYTFTPSLTPLFSLADDDFMKNEHATGSSTSGNNDPVLLTRTRPSDQYNSIKLEWLNRGNQYNPAIIEAKDQAMINQFGLRQDASRQFHMFCDGNAARISVQLQLQRQYVRNLYQFQVDQRYIVLDPMDVIEITDSTMGLTNQLVRINEITENDDNSLTIIAEEIVGATGSAPQYVYQNQSGFNVNYNANPGPVNTPVIFEPPEALGNGLEMWLAVSGQQTSLWGGCQVWMSTDQNTYQYAGQIHGPSRQGLLTASLPSVTTAPTGQTVDTVNTLAVNLSESAGQLDSGSQSAALNLNTISYADGELIAYQTATLTGTNTYNLTFLIRGAYNTPITSHLPNTQYARLDSGIFQVPYPTTYIGTTVYFKFLSFNIYNGGLQTLADVAPFAYTIQGTALTSIPADVTGFTSAYIAGLTQLTWNPVADSRQIDYEIRLGSTWNNAQVIGRTPLTQAPILGDGIYWIAAHYTVPNGPDIYSANPADLVIAGSQLTTNVIASYDEAATGWLGTLTNTAINPSNQLTLVGAGNILTDPDIITTADIIYYGGVASSGTYQIPVAHRINIGRVAPCNVIMKLGAVIGYSINSVDVIMVTDITTVTDILGIALGNQATAIPQIRLSQDGITWGNFQNWIPGSYSAKAYDFQVILLSNDTTVAAVLSDLVISVDVPDLVETGTNLAIGSGGTSITFPSPFNGGPNSATTPNIQITIINATAGDDVILTGQSLTGFTVQIKNGGVGVARSINYIAQGY